MNVYPEHYGWSEFYENVVDLSRYAYSWPRIHRRLRANRGWIPRSINVLRAVAGEGFSRIKYHSTILRLLDSDPDVRRFFKGETRVLPRFYEDLVRRDLGPLWKALPGGALMHDPNAYLNSQTARASETRRAEASGPMSGARASLPLPTRSRRPSADGRALVGPTNLREPRAP